MRSSGAISLARCCAYHPGSDSARLSPSSTRRENARLKSEEHEAAAGASAAGRRDAVRSMHLVWAAADEDGGVDSITLKTLMKGLSEAGLPLHRGHLNERRVARATAMVLVGTGLGVASVETIDGVPFASPSQRLFEVCSAAYTEHMNDSTTWTNLGGAL